jgi:hypothetical protein
MRQSPRLLQGNYDTAGGPGPTNPLLARPPATPHHPKSGAALKALILELENEYRLGLKVRGDTWSPRKNDGVESIADKVYGQIKRLFFSARPALDSALDRFRQTATGFEHHKQLELLHGVLKSITHSPISRTGTPLNEQPKSLRSVPPCKCPFASGESYAMRGTRMPLDEKRAGHAIALLPALRLPLAIKTVAPLCHLSRFGVLSLRS